MWKYKMEAVYLLLIVAQAGVLYFFVRRNKNKKLAAAAQPTSPETGNDPYLARRKLALLVNQQQLKLPIPDKMELVYGVVMDWNMGNVSITLATYITGAATLYLSSGESLNGGGKDESISHMAVAFIGMAQEQLRRAAPAAVAGLPHAGCVRFHLLTNHGVFAIQEDVMNFDDGTSHWLGFFEKANELIQAIRSV